MEKDMKYITVSEVSRATGQLTLVVDGERKTASEVAKFIKRTTPTIHQAVEKKTLLELEEWVNSSIIKNKFNLPNSVSVFWKDKKQYCWSKLIMECVGITSQSAGVRLVKWKEGRITCDDLFRPENMYSIKNTTFCIDTPTQIKIVMQKHKVLIKINNDSLRTIVETARYLNITYAMLMKIVTRAKRDIAQTETILNQLAWKYDNCVPMKEKIYCISEHEISCVAKVKEKVPTITTEGARKRLSRWELGNITTKELYASYKIGTKTNITIDVVAGDLAHLTNKRKKYKKFKPGKYDEFLCGPSLKC